MFGTLSNKKSNLAPKQVELITRIQDHLQYVTTQSRFLSRGLYLPELETRGLIEALRELVHSMESIFGIRCEIAWEGTLPDLDINTATELYRIAQEAMSNAAKHSHAQQISVHVKSESDSLHVTVNDDGIGFQPKSGNSEGMGIRIMQNRAKMIHASFEIDSRPNEGTSIRCILPIHLLRKSRMK